eukprot:10452697-Alexandrium_andersonii.AAC.1
MRPAEPAPAGDGGRTQREAGMVGKVFAPRSPTLGSVGAAGRQEDPIEPCPTVPASRATGGAASPGSHEIPG